MKKQNQKKQALTELQFEILRVHDFENAVLFDMKINGVNVYGLKVVEGKNGDFISWPSRKGKDNKYYSYAYAPLSEAQQKDILYAVQCSLDAQ